MVDVRGGYGVGVTVGIASTPWMMPLVAGRSTSTTLAPPIVVPDSSSMTCTNPRSVSVVGLTSSSKHEFVVDQEREHELLGLDRISQ